MKALILAAGRGERMRPLSDTTPKPLLAAGGRHLIAWQIAALAAADIDDLVINTAHLAAQFPAALDDGRALGVRIAWSNEGTQASDALETLGGIVHALPLLGGAAGAPFVVVSGDIVSDFDYRRLAPAVEAIARGERDGHLVLVDNPPFHPRGDMGLVDGRITTAPPWLTYANIAVLSPRLFAGEAAGRRKLFPWLYRAVEAGRISGEHHAGRWYNVGTPDELARLDAALRAHPLAFAPHPPTRPT
ncbi:MAG: nucleotidyltransferase family protein [Burkholderiaceae bacterium]|jgi:MurNAc alpha-1-phosphate uridylyltransferase|nr:nucleotidyltransferase family protein [Burkholderiaceae bacterium]